MDKSVINKLKKGEVPLSLQGAPFIVMRERIHIPGSDTGGWQWSISTSPDFRDMEIISREDARKIIRNNDMSVAHSESCGQIYEVPGKPFHSIFSLKRHSQAI